MRKSANPTYEELQAKVRNFPEEVIEQIQGFLSDESAFDNIVQKLELSGIILVINGYQAPISSNKELKQIRKIVNEVIEEREIA